MLSRSYIMLKLLDSVSSSAKNHETMACSFSWPTSIRQRHTGNQMPVCHPRWACEKTVPYLQTIDGSLYLGRSHNCYYQVQRKLLCSGRDVCYFVFTRSMISKFVKLKETIIPMVMCFQHSNHLWFYHKHFKDAVLERYCYGWIDGQVCPLQ